MAVLERSVDAQRAGSARAAAEAPTIDAGKLFKAHAAFVAGFLRRLGVPAEECPDLVQEVFLTAHRKGGYRPGAARPTTWLASLALNAARNARRRIGRRAEFSGHSSEQDPAIDGDDPERRASARESLTRAAMALDGINEDQRVVLMLHELEGESLVSIAAGLGVPKGTIYARLHRGRKAFRLAYAELSTHGLSTQEAK